MNTNIRIAKELVRLAKSLVAGEERLTQEQRTQVKASIDEMLAELGATSGKGIIDIVKAACDRNKYGELEVNGEAFTSLDEANGKVCAGSVCYDADGVEFLRIESYTSTTHREYPDLMYIYLPISDGSVDVESITCDAYTDKSSDYCVDNVKYSDL